MEYIKGTPRDQLYLFNEGLDSIIEKNNPVRVIDAYVESLNLEKLGFKVPELKTGTPPYRPQMLIKIYVYGYNDRTRSTRRLENECKRNKEMIWLTEGIAPDFKTIADFRKNNRKAVREVFKEFLMFCNKAGLLSMETIAIDGTKLRAQNSLNNVYKRDEMDKIQKQIQKKIDEYLEQIDQEDEKESESVKIEEKGVEEIVNKLKQLKKYQIKVEGIKEIFEKDKKKETYFSTDIDARFQSDNGKVRAGYNSQIAGDNKNKLIVVNDVTNESNDLEQMSPMIDQIQEVKKELKINKDTQVIMDAGYFSEKEVLNNKDKEGINIIVPDKKTAEENNKKIKKQNPNKVPGIGYEAKDFKYDKEKDICICPEGKEMHKTHINPGKENSGREVFEFQCKECDNCDKHDLCTRNKRGRSIKISANKEIMEEFKKEMGTDLNKKLISKRKEIIEHPFGTIKRSLGYTYFLLKGLENVKTEFSFICFTYNFKRVMNILGVDGFLKEIERQKLLKLAIN